MSVFVIEDGQQLGWGTIFKGRHNFFSCQGIVIIYRQLGRRFHSAYWKVGIFRRRVMRRGTELLHFLLSYVYRKFPYESRISQMLIYASCEFLERRLFHGCCFLLHCKNGASIVADWAVWSTATNQKETLRTHLFTNLTWL